jgi:gliding motility-associated-like protein
VNLKGSIGGSVITNNSPATVIFTDQPDPTNPLTALIVISNNALADGLAQNRVKAHVVDQNGNVLQGRKVVFTIISGNAQILTVQPVITDINGDAVIQLVSKKAGNVSVTAKVEGIPIVNGSPAVLRFIGIDIYVPKVFTPNGDGTNDVLKPIIPGIAVFHYFNVYNRWGNLIFTTRDANAGWDGRWNGVPQPVETYIWSAEGLDAEGNLIIRKGMVSLVR